MVLYFYPRADTPGCTIQACGVRDRGAEYREAGARVLGVSPDTVEDVKKFAGKFDLDFTLLADADHAVAEAYGAWGERSMYGKKYMGVQRSTFLIDPEGKIAKVFPKVSPKTHDDVVPRAPLAELLGRLSARLQALEHHHDDEGCVEGEPGDYRGGREASPPVQALVGEEAAREAEGDREGRVRAQRPVCEDEPDPDRDRRLEDHRAGDVAERQRVLAFADPEEAVDLLGQLGRQRSEDQSQDDGLDSEVLGDLQELFDEEVGASHHRAEADQELDHAERQGGATAALRAALEDQRVERLFGLGRAAAAEGAADIERVGEDEGDPDRDSQRRRRAPGERQGAREEGEEEEQVPLQGRAVGAQLQALGAPVPEAVDEEADQPHRQGSEQEGGADDRPDRHLVRTAGGAEQGDDRDQCLGHRRPDRGQQAADGALSQPQPVADPLHRVGEEQRAAEDDGEAERQQQDAQRLAPRRAT